MSIHTRRLKALFKAIMGFISVINPLTFITAYKRAKAAFEEEMKKK